MSVFRTAEHNDGTRNLGLSHVRDDLGEHQFRRPCVVALKDLSYILSIQVRLSHVIGQERSRTVDESMDGAKASVDLLDESSDPPSYRQFREFRETFFSEA